MNLETINKDELFSDRWIPYRMEIVRSPVLSAPAKVLYAEIVSYFWQDDARKAWPSQDTLAENLNCSPETVRIHLRELASVGVIVISRRGLGKNNEYFLLKPDPVRLQVEKNAKGDWKPISVTEPQESVVHAVRQNEAANPVVVTEPLKPTDPEPQKPTDPEPQKPSGQDYGKPNGDISNSGAVSLDVAQVPAIVLSAEEEVPEITRTEEQVSGDRSFSRSQTNDKEADMIDMGDGWRTLYGPMKGDDEHLPLDEQMLLLTDADYVRSDDWQEMSDNDKRSLIELYDVL